jgi:AcrR family transcriptional regulator
VVPKVVDHEQRREQIADALWRVVRRDGFAAASVRTVAAEAGLSTGALRHYFATQAELTAFAMASLMERARARVTNVAATVVDLDGIVRLLEEVLPLDAQRLAESEVWLAMAAAARTDDGLRVVADEAHRALRGLCDSIVRTLAAHTQTDLDVVLETDRLHALVDGLAVHGTIYPRLMPRTRIRAAVRAHLGGLAGQAGPVGPPAGAR